MNAQHPDDKQIIRGLLRRTDSFIRNGQAVYAYRQAMKLVSELKKGVLSVGDKESDLELARELRTVSEQLKPLVRAHAATTRALAIIEKKGRENDDKETDA